MHAPVKKFVREIQHDILLNHIEKVNIRILKKWSTGLRNEEEDKHELVLITIRNDQDKLNKHHQFQRTHQLTFI